MKEKLLIIGASGHGKVIADIALKMNKWQSISFLDDNETLKSSMGIEIIDKSASISKYIDDYDFLLELVIMSYERRFRGNLRSKGRAFRY